MKLPSNREELRERWKSGEEFLFYLFYGHKPPTEGVDASCLSQWFVRVFRIDEIDYSTAEHWMMAEKARLFGDQAMLKEILASEGPRDAKAFGRKVSGFDNEVWGKHKFDIVVKGNLAKFGQHDDLKQFLLSTASLNSTSDRTLVDTSALDTIAGGLQLAAESKATYEVNSDAEASKVNEVHERPVPYRLGPSTVKDSNVILVEAAGRDTIWGIGLGVANPKSQDPFTWRGLNLLGFALTLVREQLSIAE